MVQWNDEMRLDVCPRDQCLDPPGILDDIRFYESRRNSFGNKNSEVRPRRASLGFPESEVFHPNTLASSLNESMAPHYPASPTQVRGTAIMCSEVNDDYPGNTTSLLDQIPQIPCDLDKICIPDLVQDAIDIDEYMPSSQESSTNNLSNWLIQEPTQEAPTTEVTTISGNHFLESFSGGNHPVTSQGDVLQPFVPTPNISSPPPTVGAVNADRYVWASSPSDESQADSDEVLSIEEDHLVVESVPRARTQGRRKRRYTTAEHDIQREIDKMKAKKAREALVPDGNLDKKERRKKQNREAAARCRVKKNAEVIQMKADEKRIKEENVQLEIECDRLRNEVRQLQEFLSSHRCNIGNP